MRSAEARAVPRAGLLRLKAHLYYRRQRQRQTSVVVTSSVAVAERRAGRADDERDVKKSINWTASRGVSALMKMRLFYAYNRF